MDCLVSYRVAGQRREIPIRADSTIDAALLVHQLAEGACAVSARRAPVQTPAPRQPVFARAEDLIASADSALEDAIYWTISAFFLLMSASLFTGVGPARAWLMALIEHIEALS